MKGTDACGLWKQQICFSIFCLCRFICIVFNRDINFTRKNKRKKTQKFKNKLRKDLCKKCANRLRILPMMARGKRERVVRGEEDRERDRPSGTSRQLSYCVTQKQLQTSDNQEYIHNKFSFQCKYSFFLGMVTPGYIKY